MVREWRCDALRTGWITTSCEYSVCGAIWAFGDSFAHRRFAKQGSVPAGKTDSLCVNLANIRYCDTEMRFTWDPAKARKNQSSHGVSFTTAAEIFDDPNHVVGEN